MVHTIIPFEVTTPGCANRCVSNVLPCDIFFLSNYTCYLGNTNNELIVVYDIMENANGYTTSNMTFEDPDYRMMLMPMIRKEVLMQYIYDHVTFNDDTTNECIEECLKRDSHLNGPCGIAYVDETDCYLGIIGTYECTNFLSNHLSIIIKQRFCVCVCM